MPILVVVALCCAPQLTRRRIGLGATIVLIQGALAWSRTPALAGWHLLATAVAGVALAAVIITSAPAQQRARRGVAAGVLLCAAASQIFIGYGQLVDLYGRIQAGYPTQIRFQGDGYFLGTTPQDFRNRALATDTAVTVLQYDTFDVPPSERDAAGVLYGDANLLAGLRTGSGYAAFVHTGTRYLECHGPQKDEDICPNLLLPAPDTAPGITWLDVMAADSVYLSPATPPDVIQHLDSSPLWRADGTDRGYRTYVRRTPLTGRITWSEGVSVATAGAVSSFARLGGDEERYTVSTEAGGGRVVLRVPYWPGYRASVDGRPVQVSPLGGAFVQISLPAGLQHAGLTVEYAPLGVRLFWPLVGVGLLLVIAGSVLAHRRRRGGPPRDPSASGGNRHRPQHRPRVRTADHHQGNRPASGPGGHPQVRGALRGGPSRPVKRPIAAATGRHTA